MFRVSEKFLGPEDKILIIDDFMAHGEASHALTQLVKQAGGSVEWRSVQSQAAFQAAKLWKRATGWNLWLL